MSSSHHRDFLKTMQLRPIRRAAAARDLPDVGIETETRSAPLPFMSNRFQTAADGRAAIGGDFSSEFESRSLLRRRTRPYPLAGIAVYNWSDGPGAWWRFLQLAPPAEEGRADE